LAYASMLNWRVLLLKLLKQFLYAGTSGETSARQSQTKKLIANKRIFEI